VALVVQSCSSQPDPYPLNPVSFRINDHVFMIGGYYSAVGLPGEEEYVNHKCEFCYKGWENQFMTTRRLIPFKKESPMFFFKVSHGVLLEITGVVYATKQDTLIVVACDSMLQIPMIKLPEVDSCILDLKKIKIITRVFPNKDSNLVCLTWEATSDTPQELDW